MPETDNPALRRKREKRVVENAEFDSFARRIVRAYARRVASGDVEALTALRRLSSTLDTATAEAVQGLRAFGYSWADIAARLGVTRQAVQMRWGDRPDSAAVSRITPEQFGDPHQRVVAAAAEHEISAHPTFDSALTLFDHGTGGQ